MTRPASTEQLASAGEFFTDLIFFDLDELPTLGREIKTDDFAISLGGGAAITATTAALLGRPTELVTVWGDSMLGAAARRQLEETGVSFSWSPIRTDVMCGLTVAVSTRADRYFLSHPGANRFVEEHLLRAETLERLSLAGHVHFALTPSRWEPFLNAVGRLQSSGATVSWDLGWDPAAGCSQGFQDMRRKLDVLFLNEMEALKYAGASSSRQAMEFFSHPRNTVVIKLGAAGAIVSHNAAPPVRVAGIEVEAVESTGAGDAFNGGFLHAWMAGKTMEEALLSGNICGGLSTRSPGGVQALPTREEFERALDQFVMAGKREAGFG